MTKFQIFTLGAVFLGALLGAISAPNLIKDEISKPMIVKVNGLPKCGDEGHPDTGELVIALCTEN